MGAKPIVCPECGAANDPENILCDFCGADLYESEKKTVKGGRKRKVPTVVDGRLVVLDENGTQEILSKVKEKKLEAQEIRNEEKKEAEAMNVKTLSNSEKIRLFRQGFLTPVNRENFRDAVRVLKGEVGC